VETLSLDIWKRVIKHSFYKECHNILTYLDFNKEVRTHKIIETALQDGKEVGVPKLTGENFIPVCFEKWDELVQGKYGIPEPHLAPPFEISEKTLILVPGIGFDRNGNRLGFGKGYYDRFLMTIKNPLTVGLAFSFQIVPEIPVQSHDIALDWIVTENETIRCGEKKAASGGNQ
jgi:5-formyltetrahydrofolate cyclo-ligase